VDKAGGAGQRKDMAQGDGGNCPRRSSALITG
jgi:hypothetical protein